MKHRISRLRKAMPLLLVCSLISALILTANARPAAANDEYDFLRQKWKDHLDGGEGLDTSDPDIATIVASTAGWAQTHWDTMDKSVDRTYLWSNLQGGESTNERAIHYSYRNLRAMALGYTMKGSPLRYNASLKADIIGGLDWLYENWYNENETMYGNSWFWGHGVGPTMRDLLVLMYDDLTETQRANYILATDHFVGSSEPPPWTSTGGNLANRVAIHVGIGIVEKNSVKITNAKNALGPLFRYTTSGDGFYTDGSFIQHNTIPYVGAYGIDALRNVTDMFALLAGSSHDITDPNKQNVYNWIFDSFEPFLYKGSMMSTVRGRAIAREGDNDHVIGRVIIGQIAKLASSASPADSVRIKSLVKYMIQSDTTLSANANLDMESMMIVKGIMADESVAPRGEVMKHYEMPNQDRTVHMGNGYGFAIAKNSKRTWRYELTNGENQKGWYTGDGMTYLYNGDLNQYSQNYWATVNWYRLSGTTVDTRPRQSGFPQNGDGEGRGTNSWAGGTTLGANGVSGMELFAFGSTLTARKSWFMFDDEIVALGARITSSDNRTIETIVEQRKLNGSGSNALTVNGETKPAAIGWSETMNGTDWAHLQGNTDGSDIGYVFLDSPAIKGIRETQTGKWSDINLTPGVSTDERTDHYVTMWYDHGANPNGATYAYAILPNKTSEQVGKYSRSPDISVLENSIYAQTVKEKRLGVTGYNFWTDTVWTSGQVTSDKKASVMTKKAQGNAYEISVSDPTMENTGTISIEINREGQSILSADPQVTVTQLSPTIKITVDVNGAKGKTFNAKFALADDDDD